MVFRDDFGKELGYILLVLKQPLVDITKITRLQRDFVLYTKGELPKIIKGEAKKDKYIISGKKMTLKDALEMFK